VLAQREITVFTILTCKARHQRHTCHPVAHLQVGGNASPSATISPENS
jgi:hypothetical protein